MAKLGHYKGKVKKKVKKDVIHSPIQASVAGQTWKIAHSDLSSRYDLTCDGKLVYSHINRSICLTIAGQHGVVFA